MNESYDYRNFLKKITRSNYYNRLRVMRSRKSRNLTGSMPILLECSCGLKFITRKDLNRHMAMDCSEYARFII